MNIAVLVWFRAQHGGLHDNVEASVRALLAAGHSVTVVSPGEAFAQRFTQPRVRAITVDYSEDLASIPELQGPFDLVHAHPGGARVLGLQIAERDNAPFFVTLHGAWIDEIETYYQQCRRVYAVSPAIAGRISDISADLAERVAVLPNGVRVFGTPRQLMSEGADGGIRIVAASRLDKDKDSLIRLLTGLWHIQGTNEDSRFRWSIAGTGNRLPELEAHAARLNGRAGTELVTMHGWLGPNELDALYRNVDISVSPGRSAMDALAVGLPSIAVGSAGCLGLITPETADNAVRCNFGGFGLENDMTAEDVYAQLCELADSPETYEALSAFGIKLISDGFRQSDIDAAYLLDLTG